MQTPERGRPPRTTAPEVVRPGRGAQIMNKICEKFLRYFRQIGAATFSEVSFQTVECVGSNIVYGVPQTVKKLLDENNRSSTLFCERDESKGLLSAEQFELMMKNKVAVLDRLRSIL
jgi:hypothetical protein